MIPTAEEIEAARTPAGGWTKDTLAAWGVEWPPKKGWKAELLARSGSRGMTHAGLTAKQSKLLRILENCEAEGRQTPSYDEMREMLGLRSKCGIARLVDALEERGFIQRLTYRARSIRVTRPYDGGSLVAIPDHVLVSELRSRGWYLQKIAQVAA